MKRRQPPTPTIEKRPTHHFEVYAKKQRQHDARHPSRPCGMHPPRALQCAWRVSDEIGKSDEPDQLSDAIAAALGSALKTQLSTPPHPRCLRGSMCRRDVPPESSKQASATRDAQPKRKHWCGCTKRACAIALIILSVIFITAGLLLGLLLPRQLDSAFQDGATLCSMGDLEERWYTPYGDCSECSPFYFRLRLFNMTNARDVVNTLGNFTPVLQEVGPHVYRKHRTRLNPQFEGDTLLYQEYDEFEFEPELSCDSCSDEDLVMRLDTSYLSVITAAIDPDTFSAGESVFVNRLLAGLGLTALADQVPGFDAQLMRALNGLNSLEPRALVAVASALGPLLSAALSGDQAALGQAAGAFVQAPLTGLPYVGVLVERPVKDWARGHPSFLAGLALTAQQAECVSSQSTSAACLVSLAAVEDTQAFLCDDVEARVAASFGEGAAASVRAASCGLCTAETGYLFCLYAFPGAMDYSNLQYDGSSFNEGRTTWFAQNTGCEDIDKVSFYTLFDNVTQYRLWTNTSSPQPSAFEITSTRVTPCSAPGQNCIPVMGGDGTSFPPAGADINGLKQDLVFDQSDVFISQAKQNVTLFRTGEKVSVRGIDGLNRLRPSNDVLSGTPTNLLKGTGYPYNGVHNLAYTSNFPAWVSFPYFMFGEPALFDSIELHFNDGSAATFDAVNNLDENGKVQANDDIFETYSTYVDVDAATGKTFRADRRLMASYAVPVALNARPETITNLVATAYRTNVITPVYWGEEHAVLNADLADTYKTYESFSAAALPCLIVGVVLGTFLLALGIYLIVMHRRERRNGAGNVTEKSTSQPSDGESGHSETNKRSVDANKGSTQANV